MPAYGLRINIESGGIGNVASGVIRHNRDVIAYLLIVRKTCLRIEGIAHCNIRCPGNTTISAPGIEQLRVDIVRGIARIQPHHVDAPIRRHGKRAENVPLVLVDRVVVDPNRCAKRLSVVSATGEHHIGAVAGTEWFDACHYINVIISRTAGPVHCYERLPTKSYTIYAALDEIATQVDRSNTVESWCDPRVLCVGRANAVKRAPASGKKEVAVCVHVHRAGIGRVGNIYRTLPGYAAVNRAVELTEITSEKASPKLI